MAAPAAMPERTFFERLVLPYCNQEFPFFATPLTKGPGGGEFSETTRRSKCAQAFTSSNTVEEVQKKLLCAAFAVDDNELAQCVSLLEPRPFDDLVKPDGPLLKDNPNAPRFANAIRAVQAAQASRNGDILAQFAVQRASPPVALPTTPMALTPGPTVRAAAAPSPVATTVVAAPKEVLEVLLDGVKAGQRLTYYEQNTLSRALATCLSGRAEMTEPLVRALLESAIELDSDRNLRLESQKLQTFCGQVGAAKAAAMEAFKAPLATVEDCLVCDRFTSKATKLIELVAGPKGAA